MAIQTHVIMLISTTNNTNASCANWVSTHDGFIFPVHNFDFVSFRPSMLQTPDFLVSGLA